MNSWQSSAFFWSPSLFLWVLGYIGFLWVTRFQGVYLVIASINRTTSNYFTLGLPYFIRSNYVLYLYHRCHKVYVFIELCTLCYKNKHTSNHFFLPAVMLSTTRSSSSKLWLAIVLLFVSILPAYDIRTLERGRLLPRT